RDVFVETVKTLAFGRFVFQLDNRRESGLHAERQLVGPDAGAQGGVVRVFDRGQAIEPADQLELGLLRLPVLAGRQLRQRPVRIDVHGDAVVLSTEIAGLMSANAAAEIARWPTEDDETGQVAVERAEAVMHPGTERRLPAIEENAASMKLKLGRVVEIG